MIALQSSSLIQSITDDDGDWLISLVSKESTQREMPSNSVQSALTNSNWQLSWGDQQIAEHTQLALQDSLAKQIDR